MSSIIFLKVKELSSMLCCAGALVGRIDETFAAAVLHMQREVCVSKERPVPIAAARALLNKLHTGFARDGNASRLAGSVASGAGHTELFIVLYGSIVSAVEGFACRPS